MEGLKESISKAADMLAAVESKRELSLTLSRKIIRKTKNMIHAIHVGDEYSSIRSELISDVRYMDENLKSEPTVLYSPAVEDAKMEYSEALILASVVEKKGIPSFEDLGISPQSWAMGLADCIGELRRYVLTLLTNGDLQEARYFFERMDEIGDEVLKFDVPDAIVPIRRKQDVTRGILERTRSDITNAIMLSSVKLD